MLRSVMKIKKSKGPGNEPCGTPFFILSKIRFENLDRD